MEQEEKEKSVSRPHTIPSILHGAPPSVGGARSLWPLDWFHSTLHGSFMKALSFHGDYSYGSFMATYIHAFGKASFHDIHKYLRATLDEGPRSWDQ